MNEQEQLIYLSNSFKEIRRELFEEWKQKYPRPDVLEISSNKIIKLLKSVKIKNTDFEFWKFWTIDNLEDLLEDLEENLESDYKKKTCSLSPKMDSRERNN